MSFQVTSRSGNELVEPRVSFETVPLRALRQKSREKMSLLLNAEKILVTEDGYYRDWRGLFSLSGLSQSEYTLISQSHDKTSKLIDLWLKQNNNTVTLSQLQDCFGIIDRYDIHDDLFALMSEDAEAFLSKPQSAYSSDYEIVKASSDIDVITTQDLECREKNLPLCNYDAFVIYHDKDVEFATELIERCENMGYQLCVKDRDLLGGLSFESEAILNLISMRCVRLIIIVSKAFLKSPMQIFITNYGQALGIEQGKRKIIPCLLEECDLPQMLRFCFRLDFYRNNKLFNFWDKLDKSLRETKDVKSTNGIMDRGSITEMDADASNLKIKLPTTPGPLYDKEQVYKFTETPTPTEKPERSSGLFFNRQSSPESERKIWPPPAKLRSASSMANLNNVNGDSAPIHNQLSHSSFYLNQNISNEAGLEAIKKRKKWYKIFLPPSSKEAKIRREKVIDELPEIKEPKDKRPWYKKKKKDKKVAIACES